MGNEKFQVIYLPPVDDFLDQLDEKTLDKIFFNISNAKMGNDPRLFKKLNSEFWEFRTEYRGMQYRLIAFWDKRSSERTLVVVTHGLIKKTEKLPMKELIKAEGIRIKYLMGFYG